MWSAELEQHVSSFLDQSVAVSQWDEQLQSSAATISGIQAQVTDIQQQQLRLNRAVDVVQQQQAELNTQLDKLETALDELRPPHHPGSSQADDTRREETYRLAEEVDEHLSSLSRTLADTVQSLNNRQETAGGLQAQLTEILNVHLQSLQWIEAEADSMERELSAVSTEVGGVRGKARAGRNGGQRAAAA